MSKTAKLFVISVLCLFLATTFVSAGLIDFFAGKDNQVTGKAFGMTVKGITLKETVKCTFLNSKEKQKCYSEKEKFSCSGIRSCRVTISGPQKRKIEWNSSCGGYQSTIIDGKSEEIKFECVPACAKEGEYTSGAVSPQYAYGCCAGLKEFNTNPNKIGGGMLCYDAKKGKPICDAKGTKSEGWYYSETRKLIRYETCSAVSQCKCTAEVKPVCGTDGKDYSNSCRAKCAGVAVAYQGKCTEITETVKCIFNSTTSPQKCYSGEFNCTGTDHLEKSLSCKVNVKGKKGEVLTWKSTCGGYGYTTIGDKTKNTATFECKAVEPKYYGFSWDCYDGIDAKVTKKASETWNSPAEALTEGEWLVVANNTCKNRCGAVDAKKCKVKSGVNGWTVGELEAKPEPTPTPTTTGTTTTPTTRTK